MRAYGLVVVGMLAIGLTGCDTLRRRATGPTRPERAKGHSTAARVIDVQPLILGQTHTTDKVLRLPDVRDGGRTWRILAGPNPGGRRAKIRYNNPEPDIYVENGWVYVDTAPTSGSGPSTGPVTPPSPWGAARTRRVSATAVGTRFIVQEQNGVHRVILLGKQPGQSGPAGIVQVVLDGKSETKQDLTQGQTYFEVGEGDPDLPPVWTVTDPLSTVGQLVDYVESVVKVAGGN